MRVIFDYKDRYSNDNVKRQREYLSLYTKFTINDTVVKHYIDEIYYKTLNDIKHNISNQLSFGLYVVGTTYDNVGKIHEKNCSQILSSIWDFIDKHNILKIYIIIIIWLSYQVLRTIHIRQSIIC